jgi:ribonuclease Z
VKSTFRAHLVNPPYGDPGLYVHLRWQGRALLFDLGRLGRLDSGALLRLEHVFVSHTHMDHFIGFDHLLRVFLAHDARLRLYGPPGFIDNVRGRLAGYTWNLVDDYPLVLEVTEVGGDELRTVALPAARRFAPVGPDGCGARPIDTAAPVRLLDEPDLIVETIHLDHKIPCLAFVAREPTHLNVDVAVLRRLGLSPGPWLARLKTAVRDDAPRDMPITVGPGIARPLGELGDALIRRTPGQRIAYVTDVRFSASNVARIRRLARGVDLFVCEAPFLDAERSRADARAHLTARQAGAIARWIGARQLKLFHFSPRHDDAEDLLRREAEDEFLGRDVLYGDAPDDAVAPLP